MLNYNLSIGVGDIGRHDSLVEICQPVEILDCAKTYHLHAFLSIVV